MKPVFDNIPEHRCSSCSSSACSNIDVRNVSLFVEDEPVALTPEQEEYKRALYEKMNPRRRKFVDRIGYDNWDPFQAPKDPLDIRKDRTERTLHELLQEFMRDVGNSGRDKDWRIGVRECALGIIQKNGKYQGIFDFCLWYAKLLQKEGRLP